MTHTYSSKQNEMCPKVLSPFMAAVSVAPAISAGVFDGVMGFGMPQLSKPGLRPIWTSIVDQHPELKEKVSSPIYCI